MLPKRRADVIADVIPSLRLRPQCQPVQHLQQARAPQPVLLCWVIGNQRTHDLH